VSQMQDTFNAVAGFGVESLGSLTSSVVVASICIWGAWVIAGCFKQAKAEIDVFEIMFSFVQVSFVIGLVMWIIF
jgi:hypothetical protein